MQACDLNKWTPPPLGVGETGSLMAGYYAGSAFMWFSIATFCSMIAIALVLCLCNKRLEACERDRQRRLAVDLGGRHQAKRGSYHGNGSLADEAEPEEVHGLLPDGSAVAGSFQSGTAGFSDAL